MSTNPAAGALSVLDHFPKIEAALITSVIAHNLKVWGLTKLDSKYHDKEDCQTFSSTRTTVEFILADTAKEYKSLNVVLVPLTEYFAILTLAAKA